MPNITADPTAAFITYEGDWNNTANAAQRTSSSPGASVKLRFRGSALYVFGNYPGSSQPKANHVINVTLDQVSTTIRSSGTASHGVTAQPLYISNPLDGNVAHSFQLTLASGSFNLSRIVWTDPQASENAIEFIPANSSSVSRQPDSSWSPQPSKQNAKCSRNPASNITFSFEGSGVVIRGVGTGSRSTFDVLVDNGMPGGNLFAYAPASHSYDLYRNDGFGPGKHSVTLRNRGPGQTQFCVSGAQVFGATPSSTDPGPTPSSPVQVSTPTPPKLLSKGQLAGIAIGALAAAFFIIIIAGLLLLCRRRRRRNVYIADTDSSNDESDAKQPVSDKYDHDPDTNDRKSKISDRRGSNDRDRRSDVNNCQSAHSNDHLSGRNDSDTRDNQSGKNDHRSDTNPPHYDGNGRRTGTDRHSSTSDRQSDTSGRRSDGDNRRSGRNHRRSSENDYHNWFGSGLNHLCSKCQKVITGEYRLECMEPSCSATVKLHVECEDWNTPERHDHDVHRVLNK